VATTSAATAVPPHRRDPFFDNAKFLAILLVAIGHFWEPIKGGNRALEGAYIAIYTFHMPVFILISGYFSRGFTLTGHRSKRLITSIALPYVVFETAYSLFERHLGGNPAQPISLLDPIYLTWFLCVLFIWRLTTPIWRIVRWPVPLSLAIAILASLSPSIGNDLDMQRLLQFLPYFVVGLSLESAHLQLLRQRFIRIASILVACFALTLSWWVTPRMHTAWVYRRDSAPELDAPWWVGPVMTLAMFACAMLLTACFFAWVPCRRTWFTTLGSGTLYGYLLHGFFRKAGQYWHWFDAEWLQNPIGVICVTLLSGALVIVLCTPPVQRIFRFAVAPQLQWLLKEGGQKTDGCRP